MPTLRYYRIPDDAAADNSGARGNSRPTGTHNQQHEEVPAPAQHEAASATAAAAGASSQQPLLAQVPSAKIPRHHQQQQQQVGEKAVPVATIRPPSPAEVTTTTTNSPSAARRPGQMLPTRRNARAGASTTLDTTEVTASANAAANTTTKKPEHDNNMNVPGIDATNVAPAPLTPLTAREEAAAEAAAASSVASLWNGSAGMTANQQQQQQYRQDFLTGTLTASTSAAASTTLRTAPASQLLGMMTPAQQTSTLAAMELERRLLLRRSLVAGPAAAAVGMGGMGGIGMGGFGVGGGMGGTSIGRLGGGRPLSLGSGGPFITATAQAAASGAMGGGALGLGMSSTSHRPMMMARNNNNNNDPHAPMSLFAGRQPPLHQSTASAQSTLPPTTSNISARTTDASRVPTNPAPLPARKPAPPDWVAKFELTGASQLPPDPSLSTRKPTRAPPDWVANFELTPEVAARAKASASDLHLPTPQDGSSHDRAVYARMNHPFGSSIGASHFNPVAICQALMRKMIRNSSNTTASNPNTAGAVGLQHRYQGVGGGIHGGGDTKCNSVGVVHNAASFPLQQQQKSVSVSPADANTDEMGSSPVPLANTNVEAATAPACTPENEDEDDSTMGESVEQSSSPPTKLRPKLKKRPISRPKNGYNYFFSFESKKMKRREEIMGIIRKRLKTYRKDTGNGADHLFSSSLWYPDQINKTNLFAEQWGSNGIVRSGLRYRFQVEAVSDQENYRSVIKTWEAAEKFNSLDLELQDGPDAGGG